jgi:hypothetical protein
MDPDSEKEPTLQLTRSRKAEWLISGVMAMLIWIIVANMAAAWWSTERSALLGLGVGVVVWGVLVAVIHIDSGSYRGGDGTWYYQASMRLPLKKRR